MRLAREFIYRYLGTIAREETVIDSTGIIRVPKKGSSLYRNGEHWRVTHVFTELSTDRRMPVVHVMLMRLLQPGQ